jgi:hypothetical protein
MTPCNLVKFLLPSPISPYLQIWSFYLLWVSNSYSSLCVYWFPLRSFTGFSKRGFLSLMLAPCYILAWLTLRP